jgi:hypothetical protein
MTLPLQNLDDLTFDALVEEGRALIPVYAPRWNDHNISDPGITLIELFAWLTEQQVYRVSRVGAAHRRAILALLGGRPRPPRPARTVVRVTPRPEAGPVPLPATLEVAGSDPSGAIVLFQTTAPMTAVPVEVRAVLVGDRDGLHDVTGRWARQEPFAAFGDDPGPGAALYLGLGPLGRDTAPLPDAGDVPVAAPPGVPSDVAEDGGPERAGPPVLPAGVPLSLYVRLAGPDGRPDARARIRRALAETAAACEPPPNLRACDDAPAQARASGGQPTDPARSSAGQPTYSAGLLAHHAVRTAWEIQVRPEIWRRLDPARGEVVDDTRALTLDGRVIVRLPEDGVPFPLTGRPEPLVYLRCRLLTGRHDAAPMVERLVPNAVPGLQASAPRAAFIIAPDATVEGPMPAVGSAVGFDARLDARERIVWLRFFERSTERPAVRLLDVQPPRNGVPGRLVVEALRLGVGAGRPLQQLDIPNGPAVAGELRVYSVEEASSGEAAPARAGGPGALAAASPSPSLRWREWSLHPTLAGAGPADAHAVLVDRADILAFGDGERGRVPPTGALLLGLGRSTRAGAGNLDAEAVSRLADTPHNRALLADRGGVEAVAAQVVQVTNPLPAEGGAPEETLDEALGRVRDAAERPERAVTVADYEALALETPGVRLARVGVRPGFHPDLPHARALGVVTLIVLPFLPRGRPMPTDALRGAVAAYVGRRRLLGTRVLVAGPAYREIAVRARVRGRPGTRPAALAAQVSATLDRFFDPLTGGPDGAGWPFGRDVYRAEVLQAIDEVPGVDHVLELELFVTGQGAVCGNVCLGPTGLVSAGRHEIAVE